MSNPNRMFVTEHDSHITEERRIEERIVKCVEELESLRIGMEDALREQDWIAVSLKCRSMRDLSSQIWIFDQRLQDVVEINKQFARIDAHMERIEKTGDDNE
jgi:hypothetical protein